jgi:hypothetical protein
MVVLRGTPEGLSQAAGTLAEALERGAPVGPAALRIVADCLGTMGFPARLVWEERAVASAATLVLAEEEAEAASSAAAEEPPE